MDQITYTDTLPGLYNYGLQLINYIFLALFAHFANTISHSREAQTTPSVAQHGPKFIAPISNPTTACFCRPQVPRPPPCARGGSTAGAQRARGRGRGCGGPEAELLTDALECVGVVLSQPEVYTINKYHKCIF